jgi:hypothetical protein
MEVSGHLHGPAALHPGKEPKWPLGEPRNNSERGREKIKCPAIAWNGIHARPVQHKFQFTLEEWFVHKTKKCTAKHWTPSNMAQPITLVICIRVQSSSNLARDTEYPA